VNVSSMFPSDDEEGVSDGGALLGDRTHERMIGCNKAEAAGGHLGAEGNVSDADATQATGGNGAHLVDALLGEAGNKQSVSVASNANAGGGSSSAASSTCQPCSPAHKVKHRHVRKPLIYKLTSPSGKAYIGQTCWWVQRMWKHKVGQSKCPGVNAAVRKYGWDAMVKEVLWEGPEEEIDAMEVQLIELHDTIRKGYNCIPGGGFNPAKDPEIVKKLQAKWDSGETRAAQQKGYTPEVRKKISEAQKARQARDGNKQARAAGLKGHMAGNKASQSEEAKAKARATRERTRELKAAGIIPVGSRFNRKEARREFASKL